MFTRCVATLVLALSVSLSFASDSDDSQAAAGDQGWVTSISKAGNDSFVVGSATGLLLRPGTVSRVQSGDHGHSETLYEHPAAVWAVVATPDGKSIASADYRGNLITYDVAQSKATTHEAAFERWCQTMVLGPESKTLLAGNESGKLFHWSMAESKVAKAVELCESSITSIAVSPSGAQIAVADGDGNIHLMTYPGLESSGKISVGEGTAWCVTYAGGDTELVVGSADRHLYKVEAKPDAKPTAIAKGSDWITRLAVSESGEVAASEVSGKIHFASGGSVSTIGAESGVWALCFGGPGQLLVGTRKNGLVVAGQSWTFKPAATAAEESEPESEPSTESSDEEAAPVEAETEDAPEIEASEEAK